MEKTFQKFLRRSMTGLGMGQSAYAEFLGVTQSQVSRWLNGANPSFEQAEQILRILGYDLNAHLDSIPAGKGVFVEEPTKEEGLDYRKLSLTDFTTGPIGKVENFIPCGILSGETIKINKEALDSDLSSSSPIFIEVHKNMLEHKLPIGSVLQCILITGIKFRKRKYLLIQRNQGNTFDFVQTFPEPNQYPVSVNMFNLTTSVYPPEKEALMFEVIKVLVPTEHLF